MLVRRLALMSICLSVAACDGGDGTASNQFRMTINDEDWEIGGAFIDVSQPTTWTAESFGPEPLTQMQVWADRGRDAFTLVGEGAQFLDALGGKITVQLDDQRVHDPDDPVIDAFAALIDAEEEFQSIGTGAWTIAIDERGFVSGEFSTHLTHIDTGERGRYLEGEFSGPLVVSCHVATGPQSWVPDSDLSSDFCRRFKPYTRAAR